MLRSASCTFVTLAVALVTISGCAGESNPNPPPAPEPVLELGTGLDEFVPITDGDSVPIVHGIQGGYHIWGSLRARDLGPEQVRLHYTLTLEETGELVSSVKIVVGLHPAENEDAWVSLGSFVFVPMPMQVHGQDVLMQVEATDRASSTASDARRIRPYLPTE